jgi:AhpC/TSA antioxidant enzyme
MQLRQAYPKIQAANTQVVAIGMGNPVESRSFKHRLQIPFTLLSDDRQGSYKEIELGKASGGNELRSGTMGSLFGEVLKGNFGGIPVGDITQLGGTIIVDTNGTIRYFHRAESTNDNAPVADLLKVLDLLK